ncbi:uncharacterized protein TrAFT101_008249 [Trichoderma asperellum]|uniref:uncharacterized protein n=1 Tax=Trichoderma asperellum TaxID=101201 RepID=UPI00331DE5A6|nr:hypothetical protein TrAFT101_008249 [Trichoderma asperellum]
MENATIRQLPPRVMPMPCAYSRGVQGTSTALFPPQPCDEAVMSAARRRGSSHTINHRLLMPPLSEPAPARSNPRAIGPGAQPPCF